MIKNVNILSWQAYRAENLCTESNTLPGIQRDTYSLSLLTTRHDTHIASSSEERGGHHWILKSVREFQPGQGAGICRSGRMLSAAYEIRGYHPRLAHVRKNRYSPDIQRRDLQILAPGYVVTSISFEGLFINFTVHIWSYTLHWNKCSDRSMEVQILALLTDTPTNQPTNHPKDMRGKKKVSLPKFRQ